MAKLWLLDFNYFQNKKAKWKNATAFHKLLGSIFEDFLFLFIYLFLYLFLVLIKSFEILLTCRSSSLEVLSRRKVFCGCHVVRSFTTIAVSGCDSNKFAKRLWWDDAFTLLSSCEFVSCFLACFLESTPGVLLLNNDNFIYEFQFTLVNKLSFWVC